MIYEKLGFKTIISQNIYLLLSIFILLLFSSIYIHIYLHFGRDKNRTPPPLTNIFCLPLLAPVCRFPRSHPLVYIHLYRWQMCLLLTSPDCKKNSLIIRQSGKFNLNNKLTNSFIYQWFFCITIHTISHEGDWTLRLCM